MHLTPLLKGLRLGPTKVFLHEYKVLTTSLGFTNETERIVLEFVIPAPEDGLEGRDGVDCWSGLCVTREFVQMHPGCTDFYFY